jgi:hypothetical protein
MRLSALLVTAIFAATPALAQPQESSASAAVASPAQDSQPGQQQSDKPPDLPVSLDKIREALAQPAPTTFKSLDERPVFRVEVRERQKLDDLMKSLNFNAGPAIPGGIYGYEQQRNLFPAVNNPLAQPYAAFTPGEMIQVSLTTLIERYLAGRVVNSLKGMARASAEQAAREEVRKALDEFWAAQGKTPPTPPKP